jgi:hypothetical protein
MYRDHALRRAETMYERSIAGADASPEAICGAGLILLQRATFAAEDLGALLHALGNDDPRLAGDAKGSANNEIWERLTGVTVPALRQVFLEAATNPALALRVFRLPPDDTIDSEDLPAEVKDAGKNLRELTAWRWTHMLTRVADFWMRFGDVAKSTMHGFAAIAGREITASPGAGSLGEVDPPAGPFVVMVNSKAKNGEVSTPLTVVRLDSDSVRRVRSAGSAAVKLTHELCETLATGIVTGHAYGIPRTLDHRLAASEREALDTAQAAAGEPDA